MTKRHVTTLLIMLLALAVELGSLSAQLASTASVNGTIQDETGAIIPGAAVSLTNTNTGVKRTMITSETGRYVFISVLPGEYALDVGKDGFTTDNQRTFELFVNQTATFDFTLSVGATQHRVEVKAASAQVEASTAELGTVVTRRFVNDLPINNRQFTQLLALTPGASPANTAQNSTGAQANPLGPVVFPSVNGQLNRSNYFTLDGVAAVESVFSVYSIAPTVDDIQEFKVQSHNDEAQFGRVMGGVVNVVTKSGTNQFHGTFWEFFRNSYLDARNPLLASVSPLRQNQFGANVGGPVLFPRYNGRNRTFFFASYEGFRQGRDLGTSGLAITPTSEQLAGNLSALTTPIFDPFTTRPSAGDPRLMSRDPFPGNIIPGGRLDPNMVKFANLVFPKPGPLVLGRFNTNNSGKVSREQDQYSIRLDQTFDAKNQLWFRFSDWDQRRLTPVSFKGLEQKLNTFGSNWGVNYLRTFNPTTLLSVQVGHTYLANPNDTLNTLVSTQTLLQQVPFSRDFACAPDGLLCLIPSVNITNFISGGEGFGHPNPLSRINEFKGDFSKVKGNHTFKAGGYLTLTQFHSGSGSASVGFAAPQTQDPQRPGNTGSSLASFLLGVPDSAASAIIPDKWIKRQPTLGFYFQDQWKVTRRLTVNLGLRWEVAYWPAYGVAADRSDSIGTVNLNNGTYTIQRATGSCAELQRAPCIPGGLQAQPNVLVSLDGKLWHTSKDNFQPRLGLAYRLNDRTALRISVGRFFDVVSGIMQEVQGMAGTWPSISTLTRQNLNPASSGLPTVRALNPLEGATFELQPAPNPFNQVASMRDPLARNPYADQWNFGVQRQLTADTLIEINYVGSHSTRLPVGLVGNVARTPGPGNPRDRRPFPYITPTYYDMSIGRSNYNGLQLKLDRRVSHGLGYVLSYTWSKAIGIGCDGFFAVEGCEIQDPYDLTNERSVAGFDLPHVFALNGVYEFPRIKMGSRGLRSVVNNWQISGIMTAASGLPYDIGVSGDLANTGNIGRTTGYGYERLNVIGDHKLSNPTPNQWFNRAAFAVPAPFTFGNLGRNALRAKGSFNLNLSLFKDFPFKETKRLQFRLETFNATNTPIWGVPVKDFNSTLFGQVVSTSSVERQVQLGLKFYW